MIKKKMTILEIKDGVTIATRGGCKSIWNGPIYNSLLHGPSVFLNLQTNFSTKNDFYHHRPGIFCSKNRV